MQEEEGVDRVEVDDLQEFLPGAEEAGIAYALFEPDSGFADPVATTRAYIEASRRAGATALEDTPVDGDRDVERRACAACASAAS